MSVIISLIVPVYQVEKYLKRCIKSIQEQEFKDFECILIDDGSTDDSGLICDQYASIDNRFKVIHKKNGGLSSARNVALDIIKGQYICFLDSDDMIHPQMLEILYKKLLQTNSDIVSTPLQVFKTENIDALFIDNVKLEVLDKKQFIENLFPDNFGKISVTACGKLYRKEIFDNFRFPEGVIYEDLHVYLDILLKCKTITIIDTPLYYYYQNPTSITRSDYGKFNRFGEFVVREKYISFFRDRELVNQMKFAINDYLTFFMRNYFAVMLKYTNKKLELKPHVMNFYKHIPNIINNEHVCKMRKICSVVMIFSPKIAYFIARKCIPDCLIDEMR